ncbi:MAG: asparagine--tRNA ligase [Patescibacteria group bacterium]|nr:asparagine--tRNA ligase [Patescibacteria group bacterium]
MTFLSIKQAKEQGSGEVSIRGWIYRIRTSKKLAFIVMRDVTGIIQCVIEKDILGEEKFSVADKLQIEAAISIKGEIKADERAPDGFEISVKDFEVIGESHEFPIQKDQSSEFLLDIRHLAIRSRKQQAILKIRSAYVQARHEFFTKEGFYQFDAPILQPSQSGGGSTVFSVKFYDQEVYLSQSWQLYAEAAVQSLEKIYNFGPTFRAEKSKTSRHLSEFWMAEAEAAWWGLEEVSAFAKKEMKYCIKKVAERCKEDFELLEQNTEVLIEMCNKEWPNMKYREAIALIKEKDGMDVPFGKDLRTIEEQKIMSHFDTPVCVTHYPVEAMGFYKPRDPENPDEALCFDMLAPQSGVEIVGGSQRSMDISDMKERLRADGENPEDYQWYFDTREFGGVPHSGYGIGTERVIAWICGLDNIKDAIPFPRTMLRWKP